MQTIKFWVPWASNFDHLSGDNFSNEWLSKTRTANRSSNFKKKKGCSSGLEDKAKYENKLSKPANYLQQCCLTIKSTLPTLGKWTICFWKTWIAVDYIFLFTCQHFQTKGHSNSLTLCVILSSFSSFLLLTGGGFLALYCSKVLVELFLKRFALFFKGTTDTGMEKKEKVLCQDQ